MHVAAVLSPLYSPGDSIVLGGGLRSLIAFCYNRVERWNDRLSCSFLYSKFRACLRVPARSLRLLLHVFRGVTL